MKSTALVVIGIILLLAVIVLGGVFYIVDETEQVVITQFGQPIGESVTTPGLKMKVPFIQKVNPFERRFLEWDGDPNQIPTRDKRFIHVDTYARWRISDPLKYFQRLRTEAGAQSRLDDILDGETRNAVAKHDLIEVVRTSSRAFALAEEVPGGQTGLSPEEFLSIETGRRKLAEEVLAAAQGRTSDLGIEILDFRFKRINYVEQVRREVYARMISERKRIAEQFRSEGAGEAARINGEMDREQKTIRSEAYRTEQEIKGLADGKAADIYAAAYNRDPEFYRFVKTMEVFRGTQAEGEKTKPALDENTVLVLSTGGDFLSYLGKSGK